MLITSRAKRGSDSTQTPKVKQYSQCVRNRFTSLLNTCETQTKKGMSLSVADANWQSTAINPSFPFQNDWYFKNKILTNGTNNRGDSRETQGIGVILWVPFGGFVFLIWAKQQGCTRISPR